MPNISGKFFDTFALTFDTFYDEQRTPFMQWVDRTFRSDMFLRFGLTFKRMGDLKDRRVLDVGCGSGPYMLEALNRGAKQVTGIDAAPGMLSLAQKRLSQFAESNRATLMEGYFPTVKPNGIFDYAIVMGVMDYIDQPVEFLQVLKSFVTDGASVSFPSTHWLRTPTRKFRYTLRNCPVYFYREETIRDLTSRAGFSKTDIYKIPGAGMDYFVWLTP